MSVSSRPRCRTHFRLITSIARDVPSVDVLCVADVTDVHRIIDENVTCRGTERFVEHSFSVKRPGVGDTSFMSLTCSITEIENRDCLVLKEVLCD